MKNWGWKVHDGESFGRHELEDGNIQYQMYWQKSGERAEDWGVRISAKAVDTAESNDSEEQDATTMFIYFANQDESKIDMDPAGVSQSISGSSVVEPRGCSFWSGVPGSPSSWCAYVRPHGTFKGAVHYYGSKTSHFHNLTDLVRGGLYKSLLDQQSKGVEYYSLVFPNEHAEDSNVAVLQITAILPMTLDVSFVKGGVEIHSSVTEQRAEELSGEALTRKVSQSEEKFHSKFRSTFGDLGFTTDVAKYALSNMLGGIGYWYGHSLVRVKDEQGRSIVKPLWDAQLYSAVPSRSFFPRGFLWDEGFHQILIRKWNPSISREILASWLDLMTSSGWIAREQILGMESRARVPEEFIPQSPDAANPPTLFLELSEMAELVSSGAMYEERENDLAFLRAAWPRLDAWFTWYNKTQAGPTHGAYRWRGRDASSDKELNPKTLTSGLDDLPRASHPSDIERHVDLRCWMALAARAMSQIASTITVPKEKLREYEYTSQSLENYDDLKRLHWDSKQGVFADYGNDTPDVVLEEYQDRNQAMEWRRIINGSYPTPGFVNHIGYVTMFPFALGLIPENAAEMHDYLDMLKKPEHLWSPFGLRSLSKSSSIYNRRNTPHDPPYWRGAIWINMNYLVVRAMRQYSKGQHRDVAQRANVLARELSCNVVNTIVREYEKHGFVYENYDDQSGKGKGCHPFTGWTALVAMLYDPTCTRQT